MFPNRKNLAAHALVSLLLTIVATGVHHIFRLGPELVPVTLAAFAIPIVLMALYRHRGHIGFAWGFTVYTGLIFLWFGFFDGFLDHVLKALKLDNVTFLPGSEAEVVATVYQLWSPDASNVFYEGTGVLTTIFGVFAVLLAVRFLRAELQTRRLAVA